MPDTTFEDIYEQDTMPPGGLPKLPTGPQVYDDLTPDPRDHPAGLGSDEVHTKPHDMRGPVDDGIEQGAMPNTDMFGGIYHRDYARHDAFQGVETHPEPQGNVQLPTQMPVPKSSLSDIYLNAMFGRSRKPNGHQIYGVQLPLGIVQQVVGRRVGQVKVNILNVGSASLGSNTCYLFASKAQADDVANNGPDVAIDGWPLLVATTSNAYYEHESEAPLWAVSPATGGTYLVVARYWWVDAAR